MASILGSKEEKKIRSFLELLIQGLTLEDQYFIKVIVIDSPIQVLILNNIDFYQYLSSYYQKNTCAVRITKKSYNPNSPLVTYYHLFSGFVDDTILGYKFDGAWFPLVSLVRLGIFPDLIEIRRDPISITYGPLDKDLDEEAMSKINCVGGFDSNSVKHYTSK